MQIVIKLHVKEDGVYWISRDAKGGEVIEIAKMEAQGTGSILSEEFLSWRREMQAKEVAAMLKGPG